MLRIHEEAPLRHAGRTEPMPLQAQCLAAVLSEATFLRLLNARLKGLPHSKVIADPNTYHRPKSERGGLLVGLGLLGSDIPCELGIMGGITGAEGDGRAIGIQNAEVETHRKSPVPRGLAAPANAEIGSHAAPSHLSGERTDLGSGIGVSIDGVGAAPATCDQIKLVLVDHNAARQAEDAVEWVVIQEHRDGLEAECAVVRNGGIVLCVSAGVVVGKMVNTKCNIQSPGNNGCSDLNAESKRRSPY